jgi:hypothetical protein
MTPSTRAKLTCTVFIMALIAASLAAIRLADHSLTAAGAQRLPCPDGDYAWATSSEIISFLSKPGVAPASYDPSVQNPVVNITAEQTNIASRTHATVNEFKARLADVQSSDTERWSVSPNGNRLLFGPVDPGRDYDDETEPLFIRTLASGDEYTVDPEVYIGINYFVESIVWMPDSSLLLIGKDDTGSMAALYNTQSKDDSAIAIPLAIKTPTPLGVTPDNNLIYTDLSKEFNVGVSIYKQGIYPSQALPAKYTPALPHDATVNEIALSAKGDRLAWLISSIYTPPLYRIIRKISPKMSARIAPYPVLSIYISQLDGAGMRLLGMEHDPANTPDEVVHNVRWRPDGKFLSYRWRRGVYSVPVE